MGQSVLNIGGRFLNSTQLLKDLVSVFRILNVCADRVAQHAVYAQCMAALLKPCSLPFFQQKSSDEVAFEQIARESVSQLGGWRCATGWLVNVTINHFLC